MEESNQVGLAGLLLIRRLELPSTKCGKNIGEAYLGLGRHQEFHSQCYACEVQYNSKWRHRIYNSIC